MNESIVPRFIENNVKNMNEYKVVYATNLNFGNSKSPLDASYWYLPNTVVATYIRVGTTLGGLALFEFSNFEVK